MNIESGSTRPERRRPGPGELFDAVCAMVAAAERRHELILPPEVDLARRLAVSQPRIARAIRRMRLEVRVGRVLAGGVTRYAVAIPGGWRTSRAAQRAIVTEAALWPSESTDSLLARVADAFALARYKGTGTPVAGSPAKRVIVDPRAGDVPEDLVKALRRSWVGKSTGEDARVVLPPPAWDVSCEERGLMLLRLDRERRLIVLGFVDQERVGAAGRGEAWAVPDSMLAQVNRLTELARWIAREARTR